MRELLMGHEVAVAEWNASARSLAWCTLGLLGSAFAVSGGTCLLHPSFADNRWTCIEVTDATSGTPVAEAQVSSYGTIFAEPGVAQDPEPTPLRRTDSQGRTYVALQRFGNARFVPTLTLGVGQSDAAPLVQVRNSLGASAEAGGLALRIIDVDAQTPTVPRPQAILGSSPATIDVHGYVRILVVCSHADNNVVYLIINEHTLSVYFDTVSLVDMPSGFYHGVTCPGESVPCRCPVSVLGRLPTTGFTPFVYASLFGDENDYVGGDSFCMGSDGAVVPCE